MQLPPARAHCQHTTIVRQNEGRRESDAILRYLQSLWTHVLSSS